DVYKRQVVGGGMRQAGMLAAAGIVALEQMTGRLAEDHARARRLAEGLAQIPGVQVGPLYTNIFYFWLTEDVSLSPEAFLGRLREQGVLVLGREDGRFRAVTHYWITDEDIEATLRAVRAALSS
ncbi:MAG: threonine aldolase, partial [Chloroflexi bacterium]|nr:threonine aldolase [Chloroflexota bacterium]